MQRDTQAYLDHNQCCLSNIVIASRHCIAHERAQGVEPGGKVVGGPSPAGPRQQSTPKGLDRSAYAEETIYAYYSCKLIHSSARDEPCALARKLSGRAFVPSLDSPPTSHVPTQAQSVPMGPRHERASHPCAPKLHFDSIKVQIVALAYLRRTILIKCGDGLVARSATLADISARTASFVRARVARICSKTLIKFYLCVDDSRGQSAGAYAVLAWHSLPARAAKRHVCQASEETSRRLRCSASAQRARSRLDKRI